MLQCFKPFVWMHKGKTTFSERSHRSVGVFFLSLLVDFLFSFFSAEPILRSKHHFHLHVAWVVSFQSEACFNCGTHDFSAGGESRVVLPQEESIVVCLSVF